MSVADVKDSHQRRPYWNGQGESSQVDFHTCCSIRSQHERAAVKTLVATVFFGPFELSCRPKRLFRSLLVRKRRDSSNPKQSGDGVD